LQNVFENIMSAIGNNLPNILHAGADILLNLISGMVKNFPKIVSTIGTMIINMVAAIGKNLPKILQSGIEIIGKLLAGIIKAVPELIASIPEILRNIADAFMEKDWGEIGKNIIDGLVNGIKNAASSVWEALKSVISSNFENIAKDFGFGSSSSTGTKGTSYNGTKGAGYNAYPNFAQTIQANTSVAQNASTEAATESKEETATIDYEKFAGAIVTAFIESDIKVVLDKREMGRMVKEVMA